ncbi:MAG: hypothetical protein ABI361_07430 [Nitrososphaera sp.]|jgi:hypothetical protein
MSLTPASKTNAVLTNEILSWAGFIDSLDVQDLKNFRKLLDRCLEYAPAAASSESFPAELLLMSLILVQQRVIEDLKLKLAG